jgi:hypothetical protein
MTTRRRLADEVPSSRTLSLIQSGMIAVTVSLLLTLVGCTNTSRIAITKATVPVATMAYASATSVPVATATTTATSTAEATPTNTPVPTPTATSTSTPTLTPTNTSTSLPTATSTATPTPTSTDTPQPTRTWTPSKTATPKQPIPNYTMLADDSTQDAGSFKLIWEVLIESNVTKESLTLLLKSLYDMALARVAPGETRPVVIAIRVYTSRAHWVSGMGEWVGFISKNGNQSEPTLFFDEGQLAAIGKPQDVRFGLTESERLRIYQDIVRAEDRGTAEALKMYPNMIPFDKFSAYEKELIVQYKSELSRKEGLSIEQLEGIANEGLSKRWPLPPM